MLCWLLSAGVHGVELASKALEVSPSDNLQSVLDHAKSGQVLMLLPGTYVGNFVVRHPVTLSAKHNGTVLIDADGKGNAILVEAEHVVIDGLKITNWGDDLTQQNAGIYTDKLGNHLNITNNNFSGPCFGMWIQGVTSVKIEANTLEGDVSMRSSDRGNGIQLVNVKGSVVSDNTIKEVRDGVYIINSQDNVIARNHMSELRYGVHYMYSYSNKVLDNISRNTRAGFALMSSKYLEVSGNQSLQSADYGILMNFITYSTVSNSIVDGVNPGQDKAGMGREGKGFFVYNSSFNTIKGNLVEKADIGIHLTAGSLDNKIYENSFIDNPLQVKYVATTKAEWSEKGVGNYWSNYLGWDLDENGYGDLPYEPNDNVDRIVWQYPEAKLLLNSPAVLVLRWMQKQFPVFKAPGMLDSYPLMHPPTRAGA